MGDDMRSIDKCIIYVSLGISY